ncbi:DUF4136 domain-containing protein [Croceiramulus getboli]|nr:DUF4136 domain-containing protein [Flavobacteriaceae bacterium YJPT1-3]
MRKAIPLIVILVLSGWVVSCKPIQVEYDYDEQANFEAFKTYQFLGPEDSGLSELNERRLEEAADSLLQSKGFAKSENPDLLLAFYEDRYEEPQRNTVGIGVGGTGRNVGGGIQLGVPIGSNTLSTVITLDVVERRTNALLWQGVAQGNQGRSTTPEQKVTFYTKIAFKLLEKFPPQN